MSRKKKGQSRPRIRPADGWLLFECAICGWFCYVHPSVQDAVYCPNKECAAFLEQERSR
jgi:hypothetical protein